MLLWDEVSSGVKVNGLGDSELVTNAQVKKGYVNIHLDKVKLNLIYIYILVADGFLSFFVSFFFFLKYTIGSVHLIVQR